MPELPVLSQVVRARSNERVPPGQRDGNKLRTDDRLAHDWYRFVLSYPPHLVRHYVDRFALSKSDLALDPFCGTGTTAVECKKLGIPSIGIEAHPMAFFASAVKTNWTANPQSLLRNASQIAERSFDLLDRAGICDQPLKSDFAALRGSKLLALDHEVDKLLLSNSISPLPLHKTLVLRGAIEKHSKSDFQPYHRLALARALVNDISNLRFGPEVGLGAIKDDSAVIAPWLRQVETMAQDLETLGRFKPADVLLFQADARNLDTILHSRSVSAVITSPPYPNEKDYTRTTRLETVLLGFIRSRQELQTLKKALIRSNTRGVYKEDDDDSWIAGHLKIDQIAQAIELRRCELGKSSGFERLYPRVTKLYFGGIARHLANLRQFLRPGAQLAYVVGDQASYLRVLIRTGELIAEIAESLGYQVSQIDLFRTRLATATKEQLREEVVLLRWPR